MAGLSRRLPNARRTVCPSPRLVRSSHRRSKRRNRPIRSSRRVVEAVMAPWRSLHIRAAVSGSEVRTTPNRTPFALGLRRVDSVRSKPGTVGKLVRGPGRSCRSKSACLKFRQFFSMRRVSCIGNVLTGTGRIPAPSVTSAEAAKRSKAFRKPDRRGHGPTGPAGGAVSRGSPVFRNGDSRAAGIHSAGRLAQSSGLPPGHTGFRASSGHPIGARQPSAAVSGSAAASQFAAT